MKPGQRVFSVTVQGKEVLKDFDIAQAAGGVNRGVVKEFAQFLVSGSVRIGLTPQANSLPPILNGIEVLIDRD